MCFAPDDLLLLHHHPRIRLTTYAPSDTPCQSTATLHVRPLTPDGVIRSTFLCTGHMIGGGLFQIAVPPANHDAVLALPADIIEQCKAWVV
jgi:hypothetical protein